MSSCPRYYRLATALSVDEIDEIEAGLAAGELDPNKSKRRLAREIIGIYHGADAAAAAEEQFDLVFKAHAAPDDIEVFDIELEEDAEKGGVYLPKLLADLKLVGSGGEGRRMIDQGAVKIDGEAVREGHVSFAGRAARSCDAAGWQAQVGQARVEDVPWGQTPRHMTNVAGTMPLHGAESAVYFISASGSGAAW